jgi:nucleotide-binding universal stress UspA family protein
MSAPRIVVGVDGSPASLAALGVAFDEARLRRAPLHVVTAWQLTYSEIAIETPLVVQRIAEHNAQILRSAVESIAADRKAGVEVTTDLVNGHPASELLAAAEGSTLLVVGTRGTSGLTGALIGSVAHALIHHAPCPVLVVPEPDARAQR